jgi:ABC-type dipeptide/oligopeptide/nickel transport system permease subunit
LLFISRWGGATKILVLGQFLAFLPIFIKLSYKALFHTMQQEHALTAMGMGNTYLKVSTTHALSLLRPKLQAQILSLFSVSIGIESGFSYLGIGPPLPHTSLGTLLYDSFAYWHIIPWYPLSVLLCFFLLISSIAWVLYSAPKNSVTKNPSVNF